MFSMKKVEGCAKTWCYAWDAWRGCNYDSSGYCSCLAYSIIVGNCIGPSDFKKAVSEHYNLCESDDDCIRKGSGSICAYYPNSTVLQHGWCFTSNVEAQSYFEILSNPELKKLSKFTKNNEKEFLKMPLDIATT
ncbi:hypothetical protein QL285_089175 [Trifolium repens]|nr:hypothetical protein QL285_089164 [Trifolium repens]KAK2364274.1 hypothetical protein QL285_089166 [Trifolium repens]KAK2364278.1 hypothetical protein QL285_089169 [Trifolium repens]KAK2364281.1 hypothetical protein QL285_089170 [Trifolium repens]KAK2364282.1 hypothetical protein QL285_089171 [Trifolium repens]